MLIRKTIWNGFLKGLKTGGFLLRIMIPVYLVVVFLRYTPVIPFLQEYLAPVMRIFSLPGDAAIPIVAGIFSDEYGVVAAMQGFDFSAPTITIIAMIILCFHTIPLEAALGQTMGFHPAKYSLYRLALAVTTGLFIGWLVSLLYGGADSMSFPEMNSLGIIGGADGPVAISLNSGFTGGRWSAMLLEMLWGVVFNVIWSLVRVIIPLMILIEFILVYKVVDRIAPKFRGLCKVLGISNDALLPLLVGLLMGVTYGAGTLIEINKRTPLSKRDFTLIGIFLFACHGIIETTILFAVVGGSVFFICVVRLAIAVLVTAVAARLPRFAK
ncbi:MAG: nucleoside recognition domain-containing protein [Clostridiales Family XIII bacterium]|jgi:hypothetical protein|nr:nucleoside recognition domain-containing protein [Clostridiales Family XIII bacterium]